MDQSFRESSCGQQCQSMKDAIEPSKGINWAHSERISCLGNGLIELTGTDESEPIHRAP